MVIPPVAVNVEFPPLQIVDGVAVATGVEGVSDDVMVVVAVAVHPFPSVPVTVYVVVTPGAASTVIPVVADNPAAGAHANEVAAPLAVSVTAVPGLQYVAVVGVTETEVAGNIVPVTSVLVADIPLEEQVTTQTK